MHIYSKFKNLIGETSRHIKYDGINGLQWPVWMVYNELVVRGMDRRFGYQGENFLGEEWDLLILLDGCRVDLLQEHRNHPAISKYSDGSRYSIAPDSLTFLKSTFTDEYSDILQDTIYVSANPHTEMSLDDEFCVLDEVWRYAWDDQLGTVPADAVTDRAVTHGRETEFERMIVHYMQPHFPSIPHPELDSGIDINEIGDGWSKSIWDQCLRGDVTKSDIWKAYSDNLEYVLDNLETLLKNITAQKVVISADHGNSVGERGFYGHGDYPVEEVWEVPWLTGSAKDSNEYKPDQYEQIPENEINLKDRLSALGYV
jgi:hypothetical protein